MSSAMDRALLAMSLEEEEDLAFDMPDKPEYSSSQTNALSLIGRVLNPDCQKLKGLLWDMPRKWGKVGKVRGVALSQEKFQFIFNSEHDLVEVLEKGVQTYNEWALAIERWVEHPPDDFLQKVPLWLQIWNLPVDYRTLPAITDLADLVGKVEEVAFDQERVQTQPYIRVKIVLDVSRPLRTSKIVNLPRGGSTEVRFVYEKVQKRCYECQRLTHDREKCPWFKKKRRLAADDRKGLVASGQIPRQLPQPNIIPESDPLFGVLSEEQVGLNPLTGRPRIAKEVIEGMRQYLLVANEDERKIREDRVKNSVREAEQSPFSRKTMLSLEHVPLVSLDLNKGKGLVFDYESSVSTPQHATEGKQGDKLMAEAINSAPRLSFSMTQRDLLAGIDVASATFDQKRLGVQLQEKGNWFTQSEGDLALGGFREGHFLEGSTAKRSGCSAAGSSGTIPRKGKLRKRPYKSKRKPKPLDLSLDQKVLAVKEGCSIGFLPKRKAEAEVFESSLNSQRLKTEVIPRVGSPTD